jgi:hypothetical protein
LATKFAVSGLWRRYKFFTTYVAVECGLGLTGLLIRSSSRPDANKIYAWLYVLTEPITWILQFLALLEIYNLVLKPHRGIATLGRWALTAGLGISVILSGLTLGWNLELKGPPLLEQYLVVARFVTGTLLVFVLLIIVFLVYFPVSLNRNTVLHCGVFAAYFFIKTVSLTVRNVMGVEYTSIENLTKATFVSLCFLVWIVFLNRRGETEIVKAGHGSNPDDEARLLRQLDAINDTLLSSSKKHSYGSSRSDR